MPQPSQDVESYVRRVRVGTIWFTQGGKGSVTGRHGSLYGVFVLALPREVAILKGGL